MNIYFDNAALQKPKPEVIETVIDVLNNHWYNGSSVYENGLESKRIIEHTRELIAKEINCLPEEVILTGSGSESNSLAIDGWLKANKESDFVTTNIEHSSLLDNDKISKLIHCDSNGFVYPAYFRDIKNKLVSVGYGNGEIGSISNIKSIAEYLHKNNCVLHVDAVQTFGHIPIDVKELGCDMLSATAQKIGGICGSAFLYVNKRIKISPIIYGSQNNGLRGSTYNVPAIVAFGKAIELIDFNKEKEIERKRNYLLEKLLSISNVRLNGDKKNRLPNNINITIYDIQLNSQQMLSLFDLLGYELSATSACHASMGTPSHVLKAIGLSDEQSNKSLRITIGEDNTYEELDKFYNDFKNVVEQYKI